jgi:hypothetical protein
MAAAQQGNDMVAALATALTVDPLTGTQLIQLANGQPAMAATSGGTSMGLPVASEQTQRRGGGRGHDEDGTSKRVSRVSGGRVSAQLAIGAALGQNLSQR